MDWAREESKNIGMTINILFLYHIDFLSILFYQKVRCKVLITLDDLFNVGENSLGVVNKKKSIKELRCIALNILVLSQVGVLRSLT